MAFSIPTEERAVSRFPGPKFWRNFSTITADRRKKKHETAGSSDKKNGGYRRFLNI